MNIETMSFTASGDMVGLRVPMDFRGRLEVEGVADCHWLDWTQRDMERRTTKTPMRWDMVDYWAVWAMPGSSPDTVDCCPTVDTSNGFDRGTLRIVRS